MSCCIAGRGFSGLYCNGIHTEEFMEEDHNSWIKITTDVSLFYVRQPIVES